ncbi:unnamed protein product [Nyctereutes procyonoides]|uniref:(raccoon dog) hypothetical protein n=1 Tax=Nyctereutes procyonoides TaxID=34880 RepID=A0A811YUZ7_NYCPR|nr:unnamed protein product [Nyctereutes procyonoides]
MYQVSQALPLSGFVQVPFPHLPILVHPDKNQDDADRAQKLQLDQEQNKRALDVIQAGKEYKEKKKKEGKPTNMEEDDPELFKQAVYKQTMKLFPELEIKRKERGDVQVAQQFSTCLRPRAWEEETEVQEKAKRGREWQKNFEETNTKVKKEKKNRTFLKPQVKMEQCA